MTVRGEARAAVATTALVALLGAPAGLLWGHLATRVRVLFTADSAVPADFETKAFVTADLQFLLLTAVTGLLCGLAAWRLARRGGPGVSIGLALGGVAAALVAARVGHQVGLDRFNQLLASAPAGTRGEFVVRVGAAGVLLAWPLLAVATHGVATFVAGRGERPPQ